MWHAYPKESKERSPSFPDVNDGKSSDAGVAAPTAQVTKESAVSSLDTDHRQPGRDKEEEVPALLPGPNLFICLPLLPKMLVAYSLFLTMVCLLSKSSDATFD